MAYNTLNIDNTDNKKDDECMVDNNLENDDDLLDNFTFLLQFNQLINSCDEKIKLLLKHPYILYFIMLLMENVNNIFDAVLLVKLYIFNKYNETKKKYFNSDGILNIYLINNDRFIEINKRNVKNINNNVFSTLFEENNLNLDENSCMCIKYCIDDVHYRLYINNRNEKFNYNFPLDIEEYKKDHTIRYKKDNLHFFKNECNEIEYAYMNDIDIKDLIIECNGPFYDFGLINNNKIYIKNIMKELNINNLLKFEIKYKNFHLDEDKMELVEHIINIKNENEYIDSNIIQKYIIN